MAYFVLQYQVIEDYVERRTEFREIHLGMAQQAVERGELVLAGAVGDPIDGALLVFKSDDHTVAERFARNDPYVVNGLVTSWSVKPWNVVAGTAHG